MLCLVLSLRGDVVVAAVVVVDGDNNNNDDVLMSVSVCVLSLKSVMFPSPPLFGTSEFIKLKLFSVFIMFYNVLVSCVYLS